MNTKFVGDIIDEKLEQNDEFVVFSFYELRIKYNLTEDKKNECGFYHINDSLEVVVNEKENFNT